MNFNGGSGWGLSWGFHQHQEVREEKDGVRRTASDSRIISTAAEYSTLGEFFAKSSVVSANARITKSVPPTSMTPRFPVCCVVRATGSASTPSLLSEWGTYASRRDRALAMISRSYPVRSVRHRAGKARRAHARP